jgi:hypothetical protein
MAKESKNKRNTERRKNQKKTQNKERVRHIYEIAKKVK